MSEQDTTVDKIEDRIESIKRDKELQAKLEMRMDEMYFDEEQEAKELIEFLQENVEDKHVHISVELLLGWGVYDVNLYTQEDIDGKVDEGKFVADGSIEPHFKILNFDVEEDTLIAQTELEERIEDARENMMRCTDNVTDFLEQQISDNEHTVRRTIQNSR